MYARKGSDSCGPEARIILQLILSRLFPLVTLRIHMFGTQRNMFQPDGVIVSSLTERDFKDFAALLLSRRV